MRHSTNIFKQYEGTVLTFLAFHHSGGGRQGRMEVLGRPHKQCYCVISESLYYALLGGARPEKIIPFRGRRGNPVELKIAAGVLGCVTMIQI